MPVLTAEEFDKSKKDAPKGETTKAAPKKGVRLFLRHAPEGESQAGVMYEGKSVQVKLKDGILEQKSVSPTMRLALIDAGFMEVTEEEIKETKKRESLKVAYVLEHPDSTPSCSITADIAVEGPDGTTLVKIERGRATVTDKIVADKLIARGYRLMNDLSIEE